MGRSLHALIDAAACFGLYLLTHRAVLLAVVLVVLTYAVGNVRAEMEASSVRTSGPGPSEPTQEAMV